MKHTFYKAQCRLPAHTATYGRHGQEPGAEGDSGQKKAKNWSQSDLAGKVGVSYAQIGRYETKDAQPPAAVLKKIAEALDTTVDFLLNGNTEDKANASLQDAEVIRYFKEVDNLPADDKSALLRVIGGFLRDVKTKQAYAS